MEDKIFETAYNALLTAMDTLADGVLLSEQELIYADKIGEMLEEYKYLFEGY